MPRIRGRFHDLTRAGSGASGGASERAVSKTARPLAKNGRFRPVDVRQWGAVGGLSLRLWEAVGGVSVRPWGPRRSGRVGIDIVPAVRCRLEGAQTNAATAIWALCSPAVPKGTPTNTARLSAPLCSFGHPQESVQRRGGPKRAEPSWLPVRSRGCSKRQSNARLAALSNGAPGRRSKRMSADLARVLTFRAPPEPNSSPRGLSMQSGRRPGPNPTSPSLPRVGLTRARRTVSRQPHGPPPARPPEPDPTARAGPDRPSRTRPPEPDPTARAGPDRPSRTRPPEPDPTARAAAAAPTGGRRPTRPTGPTPRPR